MWNTSACDVLDPDVPPQSVGRHGDPPIAKSSPGLIRYSCRDTVSSLAAVKCQRVDTDRMDPQCIAGVAIDLTTAARLHNQAEHGPATVSAGDQIACSSPGPAAFIP